jgi:hypothetical protein
VSTNDGIAKGSLGFIANYTAGEAQLPQRTGEDTSWIGPGKGYQPITSTNPSGDYQGVSPMSPGVMAAIAGPNFSADGLPGPCPNV